MDSMISSRFQSLECRRTGIKYGIISRTQSTEEGGTSYHTDVVHPDPSGNEHGLCKPAGASNYTYRRLETGVKVGGGDHKREIERLKNYPVGNIKGKKMRGGNGQGLKDQIYFNKTRLLL